MLGAEVGVGLPAGVEEYQKRLDMVLCCDGEEGVESFGEALGVLLPELILQEDAHGVHADGFGEGQLLVVELRVEGGGLKHLELVDGVGGDEVRAYEPGLLCVPGVGGLLGPSLWLVLCGGRERQS